MAGNGQGLRVPGNRVVEVRRVAPSDPARELSPSADRIVEEIRDTPDRIVEDMEGNYERRYPLPQGCTRIGRQGVVGLAVVGCAVVGLDLGYRP